MTGPQRQVARLDSAADLIDDVRDIAKHHPDPGQDQIAGHTVNVAALEEASRIVREEARLLAKHLREAAS